MPHSDSDVATGVDSTAGYLFIAGLIEQTLVHTAMTELVGSEGAPYMRLASLEGADAGYLRLWQSTAASPIDRMVHVRLLAGPVQTQLLFLFGKDESALPHFHAQTVEFPPDGCVYNVDLMPRLDAIEHPGYFTEVFSALTKPYLKATTKPENSCAKALMNPAIASYLSPWGIVSHRTDTAELARVQPMLEAYLTHYLYLSDSLSYSQGSTKELQTRTRKHLERFFDDDLDPRAWRGVYNVIGEEAGLKIKTILQQSLQQH